MTYLPIFVVPMLAFGGFFINTASIPSYFKWLSYFSYFRYGFEALAINEWSNIHHIPGCTFWSIVSGLSCPRDGAAVIEELNFTASSKWLNIGILLLMCVVIRFIAFVALFLRASLRK
ncbi:ABC transporter ATP-binding protein/permease wht-1 [Toxocara canis]|nr:ABC transporter ATP-binding protein/permease wht-1 [Toxocara canis]